MNNEFADFLNVLLDSRGGGDGILCFPKLGVVKDGRRRGRMVHL